MKKVLSIILFLGVMFLESCNDFLDLSPISDLSPETYFQDKTEMSNWNAGIYAAFQSALQRNQTIFGDCRSDNVETTGYINNSIYMNAVTPSMSESSWQAFYQCITRCNIGISKYTTIPNISEAEYAPYMGQAYGMRAFMYFWGTRVWGKMPLVNDVWDGSLESINMPRASLEEVKDQILSDINTAINFFQIANTGSPYYLGLAAMHELKLEVYMWYNDYQNALAESEYFMNNSNYSLSANSEAWKKMFEEPSNSKEVIFAMNWDFTNNGAASGWPGTMGAANTNNGYQISQALFEELIDRLYSGEGADSRLWNTVDTVKLYDNASKVPMSYAHYTASGIQKCIKYSVKEEGSSYYKVLDTTDAEIRQIFMRLSNVYYLRAEALNKLGRGSEALDILNQLRSRLGYFKDAKTDVVNVNDQNEVENLILLERQIEFYGEGQRWFDLMRTGKLIEVMNPIYSRRQENAGVTVTGFGNEGTKYWPIYYREFESNNALKGDQNQPYPER